MVTSAQPLPTAATLAADCTALIAELQSVRARLRAMDMANGVFHAPNASTGAQTQGQPAPQAAGQTVETPVTSNHFVLELATRFDNIEDRLNQTSRRVRDLVTRGFVVSGFPSGQSKLPSP
jgi:hypothetical protein